MKLVYKIKNTLNKTKLSFERFPLPMACILLSALFFILEINNHSNVDTVKDTVLNMSYMKLGYLFLISTFVYIFLKMLNEGLVGSSTTVEQLKKIRVLNVALYILSVLLLYSIYRLFISEDQRLFLYENFYGYFGLLLFFIVSSFYISKAFFHKDYVAYMIKIFMSICISVSYSIVLFLGLCAIYYACEKLLGVQVNINLYAYTAIVVFLPFNLGVYLANIPSARESFNNYNLTRAVKVLITYILIPIFLIYLIILYLYFGKMLLNKTLFKGMITSLVLWYSIFSVGFLFVLGMIKDSSFIKAFKKLFPIAMLPVLFVMFLSIGLRINQYGFTENRYFVVVTGIFVAVTMIYYIFLDEGSYIAVPIFLSFLILASTVGPISAYSISRNSQNSRFEKVLVKNNMIKGNKILANANVSKEDRETIVDTVTYMFNNHRPWELKYIPKDFELVEEDFEEVFGFKPDVNSDEITSTNYYFEHNKALDIDGYSKIMSFSVGNETEEENIKTIGNYRVSVSGDNVAVDYFDKSDVFNLTNINSKEVFDKVKALEKSKGIIDPEDIAISGVSHGIKYKIIFTNLNQYAATEKDRTFNMDFYLLVNNSLLISKNNL